MRLAGWSPFWRVVYADLLLAALLFVVGAILWCLDLVTM